MKMAESDLRALNNMNKKYSLVHCLIGNAIEAGIFLEKIISIRNCSHFLIEDEDYFRAILIADKHSCIYKEEQH